MEKLIYDIGMFDGSDTDFYLRKGFSVVAIDANPEVVERAYSRFGSAIQAGRLVIYNVALTSEWGEVPFYIHQHEDWSRLDLALDGRFAAGTYREVRVPGLPFSDIYAHHPTPYYAKLDIEGPELLVLEQMLASGRHPDFVSVELNGDHEAMLDLLVAHGYHRFKLLGQGDKSWIRLPDPPREGRYCDVAFDGAMSGPFGEELPGRWLSQPELTAAIAVAWARLRGAHGQSYAEWFDIHARRTPVP